MNSSFNFDDDIDLIKELEAINSITSDADLDNKKTNQSNNKSNINNSINFSNPKNSNTPRKKRRSPKKCGITPKIDLDALLGPSENFIQNDVVDNDFLNLSPKNESEILSPQESIKVENTSFSLLEARIINHANNAFQKLTEDFIYELKSLFDNDYHLQNMIYTYLMSFLTDIRNEIRFFNESLEFPILDINFDLDVNSLNIRKNTLKNNFQIHQYVDRITELKSSLSHNTKKIQVTLNHEIQSRDNELISISQSNDSKAKYMAQLRQKEIQMQKRLYELEFSLQLCSKISTTIRRKLEDLETTETLKQQEIDDSFLIQQDLEQLKNEIKRSNINQEIKRLLSKVKQIVNEKNEIQQSINALYLNIKYFYFLTIDNYY